MAQRASSACMARPHANAMRTRLQIDMVVDGVEDLRMKYVALIYQGKLVRRPRLRGGAGGMGFVHAAHAVAWNELPRGCLGHAPGLAPRPCPKLLAATRHCRRRPPRRRTGRPTATRRLRSARATAARTLRCGYAGAATRGSPKHTLSVNARSGHVGSAARACPPRPHPANSRATPPRPQYLARLLSKAGGDWFVGSAPTVADLAVFEVVDLHLRPALFPDELKAAVRGAVGR